MNNVYHLQDYQDIQLGDLKSALNNDDEAVELKKVIMSGWPEDKSSLHFSVRPYFHVRDELSVDNDFIIKGQQLFIPVKLRSEVLNNLHRSHMGYDSMIRRARENMFWVGMPKAIKQIADNCDVCQRTKPQQQKKKRLYSMMRDISPLKKLVLICSNLQIKSISLQWITSQTFSKLICYLLFRRLV